MLFCEQGLGHRAGWAKSELATYYPLQGFLDQQFSSASGQLDLDIGSSVYVLVLPDNPHCNTLTIKTVVAMDLYGTSCLAKLLACNF